MATEGETPLRHFVLISLWGPEYIGFFFGIAVTVEVGTTAIRDGGEGERALNKYFTQHPTWKGKGLGSIPSPLFFVTRLSLSPKIMILFTPFDIAQFNQIATGISLINFFITYTYIHILITNSLNSYGTAMVILPYPILNDKFIIQ